MDSLKMLLLKESQQHHLSLQDASLETWHDLLSRVVQKKISTNRIAKDTYATQLFYFSMEFLPGRFLRNNLDHLGWLDQAKSFLSTYEIDLHDVLNTENDPALGNGGLGRLASCFLDSMANKKLRGHGMGLLYEYGLFKQEFLSGRQIELPDRWKQSSSYEWEQKPDAEYTVSFWGKVHQHNNGDRLVFEYTDQEQVQAKLYSIPITGYSQEQVNQLYLWKACPTEIDPSLTAEQQLLKRKKATEITEFLYPDDSTSEGMILRLKQQYFLVSAGAQHLFTLAHRHGGIRTFFNHYLVHINDTHPSMIIPELMRLFMDVEGLGWDEAWAIVTTSVHYTNHTLLAEAMEKWPIVLFQPLLPRIYEIIVEINERFCRSVWHHHSEKRDKISDMAIVSYGHVHMVHLAVIGSNKVNGVSTLHSHLLQTETLVNFAQMNPKKFTSVTNGITHRFWLHRVNPALSDLINEAIGDTWLQDPFELIKLADFQTSTPFLEELSKIKKRNKQTLIDTTLTFSETKVDPGSLFDVHCKRLHGYKRQLLNALHIWHLYTELRENPDRLPFPRTFLFAAKAAPGYAFAKKVIHYIHTIASVINKDATIQGKLKVIFIENYRISLAEQLIPAAEVSEQISLAGKEASGTGNMKLMMNGALTIGTRDGATIEMAEHAGEDNMFLFGANAADTKKPYFSKSYYDKDIRIKNVLQPLVNGTFSDNAIYSDLYYSLIQNNDEYRLLQDFSSYAQAHKQIELLYTDQLLWQKKSLANIAASGYFSSDRAIEDYQARVWTSI
ncbi:glycogen/starch/alpha-glucan family phosphorylase [Shouchella patagoniensis]|uniref:glycogen/starch/alpha-glucan family phosphorylase n=1 Tax=Shouchella patagoniensis TaxID=228576 RepID=UPI000995BACF|nr:glycogen/starch/alpha-glucan family phosphorylase [Shouchella patagoniensis]